MKIRPLTFLIVPVVLGASVSAYAARSEVICIQNKQTGRFEIDPTQKSATKADAAACSELNDVLTPEPQPQPLPKLHTASRVQPLPAADIDVTAGTTALPPSQPSPPPAPPTPHWRIAKGESINHALAAWCAQDHRYELYWSATDLTANVAIDVEGSFEDAVTSTINALNRASATADQKNSVDGNTQSSVRLDATFLTSNAPKILRVIDK